MTNKQEVAEQATFLSPGEASRMLYVTSRTLQRMATRGEVKAITLPSGHRRYLRHDIEQLVRTAGNS